MRWIHLGLFGALSSTGASLDLFGKKREGHVNAVNSLLLTDIRYLAPVEVERINQTTPNLAARHLFHVRQNTGRCGADFGGARCPDSQCCSAYGYCGTAYEHCAELVGCQPQYGRCGDEPTTTATPTPAPTPTPTSTSTSSSSTSSTSSTSVTSSTSTSTSTQPPLPSATLISTNGQCGNSTICTGSPFGNCCSEFYFCGNSLDYCGTGCRLAFGQCNSSPPISPTSSSSSTTPTSTPTSTSTPTTTPTVTTTPTPTTTTTMSSTSTLTPTTSSSTQQPAPTNVSTDGQCGATNGKTCVGYAGGRCCSSYGWCGSQDDYCRVSWGCQVQYGECGT